MLDVSVLSAAFYIIDHSIYLETLDSGFGVVAQLWNGSPHIFLNELNKYEFKEFFLERNTWPLEYYRDPALACAVHFLCCRPVSDHGKAPPRSPGLCRWPPSLPVIQIHPLHEPNWLSHCYWELCGKTEELDDFQHANGEWHQDGIIDFRK